MTTNKPRTHKSKQIARLLENRDQQAFDKTRKRMLLAAKIQDAIKAKGYSYSHFAAMLGQQPSVITKWLSGTHNFTTDTLFDIEAVLGVQLVTLTELPQVVITKYETLVFHITNEAQQGRTPVAKQAQQQVGHYSVKQAALHQKIQLPVTFCATA
jgi:transcriptional regulator with XRE-family HTH domain